MKCDSKKGTLSQLIEKTKTKEDRRKISGHDENYERNQTRRSRKSPENMKPKTLQSTTNKVRSLYRSLKGGSAEMTSSDILSEQQQRQGGFSQKYFTIIPKHINSEILSGNMCWKFDKIAASCPGDGNLAQLDRSSSRQD